MPRPRITPDDVATAREAHAYLEQNGRQEYADAVAAVIEAVAPADGGTVVPNWKPSTKPPVVLWLPLPVHQHLAQLIAADKVALAAELRRAYGEYTEGRWLPEAPARAARGQAPEKKSTSTRVPLDLIDEVKAYGEANAEALAEAGWKKPPTHRQLAELWLIERYTPQDDNTAAE